MIFLNKRVRISSFLFCAVTKVSTQGFPTVSGEKVQKKEKCWVESYTLAFSTNGSQWQQYDENGVVKVS